MKPKIMLIVLALCVIAAAAGCKKDDNPVQPTPTGKISGNVKLYNYNGTSYYNNYGVIVKAEEAKLTDTTDANGNWEIPNLPAGTHTISFTRWGFGTWKVFNYKYNADSVKIIDTVFLSQIPSYSVYNLNKMVTPSSPNVVDLIGMFNGTLPSGTKYIRLFVGVNTSVTSNPSKYSFSVRTTSGSDTYASTISASLFYNAGLAAGQKAYVIAYPESVISNAYNDPSSGKLWYSNIGSQGSNVLEVTVP